jgi:hypothetical protein
MTRRRNLDPRLTHRIVQADGYWGCGPLLSVAKDNYRKVAGRKCPRECTIWAVTPETRIDEHRRFVMPLENYVEPVDISEDAE